MVIVSYVSIVTICLLYVFDLTEINSHVSSYVLSIVKVNNKNETDGFSKETGLSDNNFNISTMDYYKYFFGNSIRIYNDCNFGLHYHRIILSY